MVLALLTVVLITAVASRIFGLIDQGLERSIALHDQSQARQKVSEGLQLARNILNEDMRNSTADHLDEAWARPYFDRSGEAALSLQITDAEARINLNGLIQGDTEQPESIQRYQRLLLVLGLGGGEANRLLASLLDWLDADHQTRRGGMESEAYLAAGRQPPANGPLLHPGELAMIDGYTPERVAVIRPFLDVLPSAARLNINTAAPEVLASVVPGLSLNDARWLVRERERAWFRDVPDFLARLQSVPHSGDPQGVATSSRYFAVVARASVGVAQAEVSALLERQIEGTRILWQR